VWSGAQAGALRKLFGSEAGPLLRAASRTFFLVTLARGVLDAQFSNYALYRFGWGPQESGPLLVPAAPPCPPHHPARRTTPPAAPPRPPHHPAPLAARPLAPLPPCALPLRGP
jgi:hypothetical protein